MSTLLYCDNDDCRNTENDTTLYEVKEDFAKECVKWGWFMHYFNIHVCEDCINNYFNEEDEQMAIDTTRWVHYVVAGKDFKPKGK